METQLQIKHMTKNYQISEESQPHEIVQTEMVQEIELIDKLNRLLHN